MVILTKKKKEIHRIKISWPDSELFSSKLCFAEREHLECDTLFYLSTLREGPFK